MIRRYTVNKYLSSLLSALCNHDGFFAIVHISVDATEQVPIAKIFAVARKRRPAIHDVPCSMTAGCHQKTIGGDHDRWWNGVGGAAPTMIGSGRWQTTQELRTLGESRIVTLYVIVGCLAVLSVLSRICGVRCRVRLLTLDQPGP